MSNSNLYREVETLPSGESLIYLRENFCHDVDEEDRVAYISVARQIASQIQCEEELKLKPAASASPRPGVKAPYLVYSNTPLCIFACL